MKGRYTLNEALAYLEGRAIINERQFLNWIGSGKICVETDNGNRYINRAHLEEIIQRRLSKWYSLYYRNETGEMTEYINSRECAAMWCVNDRQARNIIGSGKVTYEKVGREYFVPRAAAEEYRDKTVMDNTVCAKIAPSRGSDKVPRLSDFVRGEDKKPPGQIR